MKKTNKIFTLITGVVLSSQVVLQPVFAIRGVKEVPIENTLDYLESIGFNPVRGTESSKDNFDHQFSNEAGKEETKCELTSEEKKRIQQEEKINRIKFLLKSVADLWIQSGIEKPNFLLNKYENVQKVTVLEHDLVSIIRSFMNEENTQFIKWLLYRITVHMEYKKYSNLDELNESKIELILKLLCKLKERLELLIKLDNPRQNESKVNVFAPEILIDTPENLTMGNMRIIVMPCERELHDAIHMHLQISNELSQKHNILGVNIIDVLYQVCIYGGLENFSKGVSEYVSKNCKYSDLLENLVQFVQENNFSINDILNSIDLTSKMLNTDYTNIIIRGDKSVEEYYKFNDFLRVILDNLK